MNEYTTHSSDVQGTADNGVVYIAVYSRERHAESVGTLNRQYSSASTACRLHNPTLNILRLLSTQYQGISTGAGLSWSRVE